MFNDTHQNYHKKNLLVEDDRILIYIIILTSNSVV